jgi:hypothetical protein
MTEEDIRQLVREFKGVVSEQVETLHHRMDEIHHRFDTMETAIMNEMRSLARRVARLEDAHR